MRAPSFFQTYSPCFLPRTSPSGMASPCQPWRVPAAAAGQRTATRAAPAKIDFRPAALRIARLLPGSKKARMPKHPGPVRLERQRRLLLLRLQRLQLRELLLELHLQLLGALHLLRLRGHPLRPLGDQTGDRTARHSSPGRLEAELLRRLLAEVERPTAAATVDLDRAQLLAGALAPGLNAVEHRQP